MGGPEFSDRVRVEDRAGRPQGGEAGGILAEAIPRRPRLGRAGFPFRADLVGEFRTSLRRTHGHA